MSLGEIDHFATMLTGCENINSGGPLTPDGKYALGVLRLHAVDFGGIAGQEGFLDSIKRGASNIKEWIVKVLKAIWAFLTRKKKRTFKEPERANSNKEDHERVEEVIEKIPHVEKVAESLKPQYEQIAERIAKLDTEAFLNIKLNMDTITGALDNILSFIKQSDANRQASKIHSHISRAFSYSRKELYALLDGMDAKVKRVTPEEERTLSSITVISKDFTELHARIEKLYDDFME